MTDAHQVGQLPCVVVTHHPEYIHPPTHNYITPQHATINPMKILPTGVNISAWLDTLLINFNALLCQIFYNTTEK